MDSESVKKMLRSVLQSSKSGVAINRLQSEFRSLCGESIPVQKLGFSSLEDYLQSIPSVVRLESRMGALTCFAAVCKETAHIAELVARQKSSKKSGQSQVVNCKMRSKPSNPYALNVKPRPSLRQPSNWTANRSKSYNSYRGTSASGDVRKLDLQLSPVTPVEQRHPIAGKPNYFLDKKEKEVNQRPPDKPPTQVSRPNNPQPTLFNMELEQSRLSQVLNMYSCGLWLSKLPDIYSKVFNEQPHPQTLCEIEKWTHICSLEKVGMPNKTDRLIYPPLSSKPPSASSPETPSANDTAPTFMLRASLVNSVPGDYHNLPTSISNQNPWLRSSAPKSASSDQPDILSLSKATFNTTTDSSPQAPSKSSVAVSEDVRKRVKELLSKYRRGLWVQALPKLFEDTYKMPFPEHTLEDLSHWLDICSVEYPVPQNKTKAILYYSGRDQIEITEDSSLPLPSGVEVVGPVPPHLVLPSEQYPSVFIADAKSSNAITVRYVGENYSYAQEAMEEAMHTFYSENSTDFSLPKVIVGQCVAFREDEGVTRAQVMEVISPDKVKVYYLDYGASVETSTHNLRKLHPRFLSLPFQAVNVKLADLSALVEKLTLNSLTRTGSEDLAVSYTATKTDMQSLSMPPPLELPQLGQNMDVFVPLACHPGYFVLQPWQDQHKLVVLMDEMVLYYNKTSQTISPAEIKKGGVYAAKLDKNWHRVLVKEVLANGLMSVYALDNGTHELVRSTAIQPLIEEFRQLPFQAIIAQMAGFSHYEWSEEAAIVFRNHVENRALVASVEEASDVKGAPWERRLTVYLVDTTVVDNDLWIHTIMANMCTQLSSAA